MLDLHCHILPGLDDGAIDLPDALGMARDAVEQGIRAVFATSHLGVELFGTTPELLREEHAVLVAALAKEGIPLEVLPGAENFYEGTDPERFAENAVPLGDEGRYVLLDFSLRAVPEGVPPMIAALVRSGRVPVIAHPERNRELQIDPQPIAAWIEAGALIQVNASSLLGASGEEAQRAAGQLLKARAAHVLASDAHSRARRPFCLGDGRVAAVGIVGEEEAWRLVKERPWRIARGEDIAVEPVVLESPPRRASLLDKLRGRRE